MGRRDYRHREPKKAKKDAKKLPPVTIMAKPGVEVIKKVRKKKEGEEVEP